MADRTSPAPDHAAGAPAGLVLGSGALAAAVAVAVERVGGSARRLPKPTDREIARALAAAPAPAFAAIVSHDDVEAMRWALVAEHARPGLRLLVTIFDRTVANQIRRVVPNCAVVSLADAAVPALVAACLGEGLLLVGGDGRKALRAAPDGEIAPLRLAGPSRARRLAARLRGQLQPFDGSAKLLVAGVAGLLAILALDTLIATLALGHRLTDAIYESVRAATAVGPNRLADEGPTWYRLLTAATMLATTVALAGAIAGLVNRVMSQRLVTIVGRRTLPRRDHVLVVGLGQVGLRLCLRLRELGIGVVAIERRADAPLVQLAKRLGVPVVIGDGRERGLLERLAMARARAFAAVSSDDLENISASVTALAIQPRARIVLRAGDGNVVSETRALFPIGTVCDVARLAAAHIAALALGAQVDAAFQRDGDVCLRLADGSVAVAGQPIAASAASSSSTP